MENSPFYLQLLVFYLFDVVKIKYALNLRLRFKIKL
nr:MAG TPA: hypothetical protein [Caudoviricetes sp.]